MKLKKIDFTKLIVKGTHWFSSLALLNLCWLLFSLPIVTLIPATDTVFTILTRWEKREEEPSLNVFSQFKQTFKENFKSSYKLGILLMIMALIIIVDIYYLSNQTSQFMWFQLFKYAFYTFTFLLSLTVLYTYPLMKQTGEEHLRMFVVGLFMIVGHPLITLGVIGSLLVLVIIFLMWPGMLFFFGVSSVAFIMTKAVSKIIEQNQEEQTV